GNISVTSVTLVPWKKGTETLRPPATILNCAECWDASRLLSINLSEWMHAAILYTRMYGGV
ncbi:hypothetical protein M9458_025805, partial [Cirrhinus mrigala]